MMKTFKTNDLANFSDLRPGFALVVSLTMLILLTLLAVGMLSLSAVTLRSSSQGVAQAEARANARLALMLAVGELQKQLGPDRRVSASAAILDDSPGSEVVDGVANPHFLGVWDSWDTWLTDRKGGLAIQDTYKRGRDPSLFRGWLVSHPDAGEYRTALSAVPSADSVVMCGEGSAGADPAGHVRAGRVRLTGGGRSGGSFAWWVADESQKARLDMEARDEASDFALAQGLALQTGRMGVEKMAGMGGFDTTSEALAKTVSIGQAGLSAVGAAENFHDITSHSQGLLTDVRSGGFKGDLNLAFESEVVPEEMDGAVIFSGRPYDAPIRPMTGELGGIVPQNPYVAPMSWRQLREYYRLYRDFPGSGVMQPVVWPRGAGAKPETRRFLMGRPRTDWDTGGYARQLVMLRQTWVIATKSEANSAAPGGIDYFLLAIPVLTLWNPYNVTMMVESGEVSALGGMYWSMAMHKRVYRGDTLLYDGQFPDTTQWANNQRPNSNLTSDQLGYRMIPTESRSSSPVEFQPGEIRVFSTDVEVLHGVRGLASPEAMSSRHFFASPGYTPVQNSESRVLRGLKYQVNPGPAGNREPLTFALRLAEAQSHNDNFYYGAARSAALMWNFQEVLTNNSGLVYEGGTRMSKQSEGEWHDVIRTGATSVNWVPLRQLTQAWIVRDDAANRARWGAPGSPPIPVGIFSVVAKSAERLSFDSTSAFAGDFRNRTWLHAPPTRLSNFLMNPNDLNRADSAYQLHFRPVNGDQEVSEYLQADGRSGFFGGGYTPARGQSHISALGIPLTPITNLGSFSGVRMDHARSRVAQADDNARNPSVDKSALPGRGYYNLKHLAHAGAAFGPGIGNGYAHPMIDARGVYTRHDFGRDQGWQSPAPVAATNLPVTDDHWDHLFLANEGLWDSWFCSGIVPVVANGRVLTPKKSVAEDFFSSRPAAMSPHFQPYLRGRTPGELADLVEASSSGAGRNGWDVIGSHILNKGQFNVNSTSKEAWKALLMSLSDRPMTVNDPVSGTSVGRRDADGVVLSRHLPANSGTAAGGPLDDHAWRGMRELSEGQIDMLAGQIVRQVKLRGPFLNMTEFINRRLSDDDMGVVGALQAAIDWDEFNAGYSGGTSGAGESINRAYKGPGDMISEGALPAAYPNRKAATGSRFAGISGYVMQADILQGISASLSVRGDTFTIRAYGESLLPDGRVAARAWCEAVAQRMPEYVDPADEADKRFRSAAQVPGSPPDLQAANLRFGRRFDIIAFRWLNPDEI